MRAPLPEIIERLAAAYQAGSRLALLFDYDGTLTPIVASPSLAVLDPRTRRALSHLAQQPGVGVGIVSGRGLVDLRHLVALPDLYYAGTAGLELDLRGRRLTHPRAEEQRKLLTAVMEALDGVVSDYRGAWVEDRGLGLTLHYRQVAPLQLEELWERARRLLRKYGARLRVVPGPMAWEVNPAIGWHKGSAVRAMAEAVGQGVLVLYAGDSDNDVEALEVVVALGGISVGVGATAPPAQHRIEGPSEVLELLIGLIAALEVPKAVATA
jgi:trehalose-phosphatase